LGWLHKHKNIFIILKAFLAICTNEETPYYLSCIRMAIDQQLIDTHQQARSRYTPLVDVYLLYLD